jgi:YHS domain-containing protein
MSLNRRTFIARLSLLIGSGAAGPVLAQQTREIFLGGQREFGADLAAAGYDTVAYHTQRQAVPGNGQFRVSWKGAEWRFSSLQNRDLFVKEPDKYAPQYGGWCAFAIAQGVKSPSDPRLFDVVNGRLYLNQSQGTLASWRRDQANMIARGDQNWPQLINR